jgi:hypothetical protein
LARARRGFDARLWWSDIAVRYSEFGLTDEIRKPQRDRIEDEANYLTESLCDGCERVK